MKEGLSISSEGAAEWKTPDTTDPKLRGTLIKPEQSTVPEPATSSILKGKGLEIGQEKPGIDDSTSKLRGNLIRKDSHSEDITPPNQLAEAEKGPAELKAFLESRTYINRDSGQVFTVRGFTDRPGRPGLILLLGISDGAKISLNIDDFVTKIKTEGSPWRIT